MELVVLLKTNLKVCLHSIINFKTNNQMYKILNQLNKLLFVLALLSINACTTEQSSNSTSITDYTQFVDPYIGSDYHGHVFVGANVPFGAVQLGPNNPTQGWDWCSGYHYSDSLLIGFAHTQLSGTGIGDLGDILFMPVGGDYTPEITQENPYHWQAKYTHADEVVKPGYYSIDIKKYNVKAELTTTDRVGFHKYNFKTKATLKY